MSKLKSTQLIVVLILLIVFVSKSIQIEYVVVRDQSISGHSVVKRQSISDAPKIREFLVTTKVANRFAETSVISLVENGDSYAKQTAFSVVLPKRAFISGFYMEIDGQQYKAFVEEKEKAKTIFTQSIATGQTAGHVAVSAKNSNRFTITVNVEPQSKVRFHLDYEELLERENGQYEIVTNIQPGQIVKKLRVEVNINESQPLDFVRTPILQPGSNLLAPDNTIKSQIDPHARVRIDNTSAVVVFQPDIQRQLEFACEGLGNTEYDGFAGQFVVKYDIVRNNEGGETLYQDGFFINFFAPQSLDPLPKHIVFVLDTSGSMWGLKIDQLKDAMLNILPQLNEEDLFSIIQFESTVFVWDINSNKHDVFSGTNFNDLPTLPYGTLAQGLLKSFFPPALPATKQNIDNVKLLVEQIIADGLTNSLGALEVGLLAIQRAQEQYPNQYQPIMVFLTDGLPNVGSENTQYITSETTKLNVAGFNAPIYSLSFGDDADWNFLRDLSLKNNAQPRKIPADLISSDVLQDFYKSISVPLLSNVSFNNLPQAADVTLTNFPIYFNGSEIVIAGKGVLGNDTKPISVSAKAKKGQMDFEAQLGIPLTRLERVWAYLTVKQLADQYYATGNTTLSKLALEISKNYSLVSEFTSLVVIKPDTDNGAVDLEDGSVGIFPRKPSELPMCNNITDYIIDNFGTTEPEPTTTLLPIDFNKLIESDVGVTATTEQTTTPTTTTTTTEPTTTTTPTTTTRKLTCEDSIFGCCPDGVTFSLRPNGNGCDPIPDSESCSLPQDKGPCTNITAKWFYSNQKHTCALFKYGGCDGNGNRFSTKEACRQTCVDPIGVERCKLPISLGGCNKRSLYWFYDQSTGECVKFMYGGCFGNSNRFTTKEDCLKLCNPSMLQKTLEDACYQPQDKGHPECRRLATYYFFDTSIGQCKKFWFSGCGGNDNRFKTKQQCENLCIYSKNRAICHAPPVKGPCTTFYQAWFFDTNTGSCQPFVYGGCRGNQNKFASKSDCEKMCLIS